MAIEKPSAAAQTRTIAEQAAKIEKLEKDLKGAQEMRDYYSKQKDEANKEVESIHALLDVLPNALARKTIADPEAAWNVTTHNLMTRFASYLALRG